MAYSGCNELIPKFETKIPVRKGKSADLARPIAAMMPMPHKQPLCIVEQNLGNAAHEDTDEENSDGHLRSNPISDLGFEC